MQLFPNTPLVLESSNRVNIYIKMYIDSYSCIKNLSYIKTFLNINKKLLAIKRGLVYLGITLVIFLSIQSLA